MQGQTLSFAAEREMPLKNRYSEKRVYQLKVTLRRITPPIWRRILVPHDIWLDKLHRVLQIAMGWTDKHLHKFVIKGASYKHPAVERLQGDLAENETSFKLYRIVPREKERFEYMYDFGDYWVHEIVVEKILPLEKGTSYPVCVAGKRACPPEDCGGPTGYRELLEIFADPSHPEHEDKFSWLPGDFDSEKFDIKAVNRRLARSSQ